MDTISIMKESGSGLNQRIAQQVRDLRAARGLSLDALATRSGVSRSMLSLIERGECSPSAVVLESVSAGLGVVLASLFGGVADGAGQGPVARRADQPEWRDPDSGYVRRNVSPAGAAQPLQIVEVRFPPGGRVAFETVARDPCVHQQVWVLDGAIDITAAGVRHSLRKGDCLAMRLDSPTLFHNPTRRPARYMVAAAWGAPSSR